MTYFSTEMSIKLYNYHEYVCSGHDGTRRMVGDFPNPYVAADSLEFRATRVVRVPREYAAINDPTKQVPQFSTFFPGNEPGALVKTDLDDNGTEWGVSSERPLEGLLSESEFQAIITTINDYLLRIYTVNAWKRAISYLVGILSFWILDLGWSGPSQHDLDRYITNLNETYAIKGLKFISPFRSGLLSFDIVIPSSGIDVLQEVGV